MHIQHTALATAATTASLVACTITKIQGMKLAAGDLFLQLHDTKATPAAAAVPVRVWPIYGSAPFGEAFIEQPVALLEGATFVVSSTAGTYTASAATVNITVDGNAAFDSTGVSYAGDYTTGTASLDVFASGNRLLRLEFTSLTDAGANLYAKILCSSGGAGYNVGDRPFAQILLPREENVDSFFDVQTNQTLNNVWLNGCNVIIEATPGPIAGDYSGTDYAIKATFK